MKQMVKLNFFKIGASTDFTDLRSSFDRKSATPQQVDQGHRTLRSTDSLYKGEFFCKNTYEAKVLDSDQSLQDFSYDYFLFIKFFIVNTQGGRYLVLSGAKAVRPLIKYVSEEFGFKFYDEKIDLNSLIHYYADERLFRVLKVKYSNIFLSKNSSAIVEVVSNQDAMSDFLRVFKSSLVILRKIKISFYKKDFFCDVTLEVSDTGIMSVSDDLFDEDFVFEISPILFSKKN